MQPAQCCGRGTDTHHRRPDRADGRAELFAAEALPHLGRLYPAALRLAGEASRAEALVMDTYARAYASQRQRGPASMTAWLYRNMAEAAEDAGLAAPGTGGAGGAASLHAAPSADEAPQAAVPGAGHPGTAPPGAGHPGTRQPGTRSSRAQAPPAHGQTLGRAPGPVVRQALQQLPARSRLAVYLADVEGFSCSKIARMLQLPRGVVTSRLHRGHRQLRAELGDQA